MKRSYTRRAAFTLVELLTVVIIIGFLAGMVAGTAPAVMRSVKASAIRAEIQQLSLALEAYKAEYGEYPPDGTDQSAVTKHIRRCYPDATNTSIYTTVTPKNALYVFLSQHDANPRTPFSSSPTSLKNSNSSMTKGFFEFEASRLSTSDYTYTPNGCIEPFVYLKARGATGNKSYPTGSYVAYKDTNNNWYNPETYQLISAGLDDEWGPTGAIVVQESSFTGNNKGGLDNIVNFGKKTIKDLID